ncbi:hypothetical protein CDAR_519981 [Caerostris darwini]|uniref:Uncharacterized protein n=1 Tax=Caerostris darwini TaxID=1538125 RepID=A0AAV4WTV6_9ARAC|nr:hypothetical protein CDAR_519981 [Caerostris darwini]
MTMKDDYLFPMYRFIGRADSGSFVNRRVNLQKRNDSNKTSGKESEISLGVFFSFSLDWRRNKSICYFDNGEKELFKDEDGEEQPHNERI